MGMFARVRAVAAAATLTLTMTAFGGATDAQAAYLHMDSYQGNDCSGVFGQGFENCAISGSPIIAKFTPGEGAELNNSAFPSVNGAEWSFDSDSPFGTGTWTYSPGANDPSIRYWVAKAGNEFNLFYYTELAGGTLADALAVTTGSWITPLNQQGAPRGLSHISFYDTGRQTVSEPTSLALLALSLIGIALTRTNRRRID